MSEAMKADSPGGAAPARGGGFKGLQIDLVRRGFPAIFLAVLIVVFTVMSPRFLSLGNLSTVLEQGTVLLVTALGASFIIMAGSIDISVGAIVAVSALVAAMTADTLGPLAIIPAVAVGGLCGCLNGLLLAVGKVPSFVATLGTQVVYRGLVLYFTRGAPVEIRNDGFLDAYSSVSYGIPHTVVIGLALAVVAWAIFRFTVFGREVLAIGGGERVSILTGIAVTRVKILMFLLLGAFCGMAGLLQGARTMAATSQLGLGLELDVIASVVVGGTPLTGGLGSITHTFLGVLIITLLSNGMNMSGVDPYLQNIIKGVVLIVAVFINIDRKKIGIIK
jgi:ribose transport system permease protein